MNATETKETPPQETPKTQDWGSFVEKWTARFRTEAPPAEAAPSSQSNKVFYFVLFLKVLVHVTNIGFIISLFWDFSGTIRLPWTGEVLPLHGLLRTFTAAALIGYGTDWLAIRMLFYPREKRPLFGQGVIPSRKDLIIAKLASAISEEIINARLIVEQIRKSGLIAKHTQKWQGTLTEILSEKEFRAELAELVRATVIQFLRSEDVQRNLKHFVQKIDFEKRNFMEAGLLKLFRMVSGDKEIHVRLNEMIESVTLRLHPDEEQWNRLLRTIPQKMSENSEEIEDFLLKAVVFLIEHIDVKTVILDNLKDFDEIRLEKLLLRSTSDQLDFIQYMGCLLGYMGGFILWRPIEAIVFFVGTGLILWGIDSMLLRMRKRPSRPAP